MAVWLAGYRIPKILCEKSPTFWPCYFWVFQSYVSSLISSNEIPKNMNLASTYSSSEIPNSIQPNLMGSNNAFLFLFLYFCRRTNELKAEVDIPDDIIMQFTQFWSDFKDTPLKGATNFR